MKPGFWLGVLLASALLMVGCGGGRAGGDGPAVSEAWARPAPAGGNSAAYFVIENPGGEDALLSAAGDVAAHVELHRSEMADDGTMSMHHQEGVPIPGGERVAFEPGGLHVMLVDLPADLQPGDTFPLTLTFEKAGEIRVDVTVKEP